MDEQYNRAFKGVWISKEIWLAKDLGWSEKLLLVEIDSLDSEQGCFASNEYLANFFGLSKNRISKMVSALKEKGYIKVQIYYKEGTKQIEKRIIRVNRQRHPIGENANTYGYKRQEGIGENANTPIGENAKDNNTFINNTDYITTTTDQSQEIFKSVQENIRFNLSPIEQQTIDYWLKDYPHDLILEAIKRAALSNVSNIRYVESILKDWQKKRITTIDEVKRDDEAFNNSKGGAKRGDNRPGAKQGNRNSGSFEDTFGYDVGF